MLARALVDVALVDSALAAALARATDPATVQHSAVCDDLQRFAVRWRAVAPRRAPVHPLLARHAASHGLARVQQAADDGRLASLANSSRIFHMTHIAKTGGRSVRAELMRLVKPVGGAEQCYPPFMHASRVNIIFFREPRAHVLSQYLHGATVGREKANAKWLRRKAAGYPMGDGAEGLTGGLARWAAHFARGWSPARGDFFSYNPLNMMARRRVPSVSCGHHTEPRRPRQRRRHRLAAASLVGRPAVDPAVAPGLAPVVAPAMEPALEPGSAPGLAPGPASQPPACPVLRGAGAHAHVLRGGRCTLPSYHPSAGAHAHVQGRALELRLRQDVRGVAS